MATYMGRDTSKLKAKGGKWKYVANPLHLSDRICARKIFIVALLVHPDDPPGLRHSRRTGRKVIARMWALSASSKLSEKIEATSPNVHVN